MTTIALDQAAPRTLWEVFLRLPDRRAASGRRYPLPALLSIAVAAMMSGRKTQIGIVRWARELPLKALRTLGIAQCRSPCPATWSLFFRVLDVAALEDALSAWVRGERRTLGHVAIDGKRLRGSRLGEAAGVHLVAAYAEELQGVVGTAACTGSSEYDAMLDLIRTLPLRGAVVTADAAFTKAKIAQEIRDRGGHYLFVVKDNHRLLKRDIANVFNVDVRANPLGPVLRRDLDTAHTHDRGHGREEWRVIQAARIVAATITWPGASQVAEVTRIRQQGKTRSEETAYLITSLPRDQADAADLLALSRSHWVIENGLHYIRDVTFAEDAARTRTGSAPQALAALRNACVTMFRRMGMSSPEGMDSFALRGHEVLTVVSQEPRAAVRDPRARRTAWRRRGCSERYAWGRGVQDSPGSGAGRSRDWPGRSRRSGAACADGPAEGRRAALRN